MHWLTPPTPHPQSLLPCLWCGPCYSVVRIIFLDLRSNHVVPDLKSSMASHYLRIISKSFSLAYSHHSSCANLFGITPLGDLTSHPRSQRCRQLGPLACQAVALHGLLSFSDSNALSTSFSLCSSHSPGEHPTSFGAHLTGHSFWKLFFFLRWSFALVAQAGV